MSNNSNGGNSYMLSIIEVRQRELWDTFVNAQSGGHFLQSWGWGTLKAGAGWHPLRLALWDTQREQIIGGAQILRRTAAHMPPRLGHLAYIPRGPVLDWSRRDDTNSTHISALFFAQLLPFLRRQGAIALQVELPFEVGEEHAVQACDALMAMQFHPVQPVQPIRTIVLDLAAGDDSLLANMKEKWRYNIRLAGRKGVQVRVARTQEDVEAWYRLLQITGRRDHFGIHTFDYYWRAWQLFAPRQQAQLLLAEYEGQLLAGIFVGCMARQAIYLYGASSNEHRNLMPNYLLQWEAIRWAREQGATSYDFWGIPQTDDAGEAMAGVYRFKSGWGGRIVHFAGSYEYVFHPLLMSMARRITK
ncbi:MAG TPA: peptidoglycan bridge formation glycyltransferase FemA/FemB family protein [Ktedonobacteraceae bacterium]|nr:peptidoglycan bridge formation glycyltransferase FemA/FemB family protein [Ktedonobacteraceae bacterium]